VSADRKAQSMGRGVRGWAHLAVVDYLGYFRAPHTVVRHAPRDRSPFPCRCRYRIKAGCHGIEGNHTMKIFAAFLLLVCTAMAFG
jgi:hypothetical protein